MIHNRVLEVNIQGIGYYIRANKLKDFKGRMDSLMRSVAAIGGITLGELKSKSRKREIVICRQIVAYIAYKEGYGSYSVIGVAQGGFDHSSVIHSVQTIENHLSLKDKETIRIMKQLSNFHKIKF